nr:MAG TPA: hypothetical protein [Caudoviricetes sp.]
MYEILRKFCYQSQYFCYQVYFNINIKLIKFTINIDFEDICSE